MFNCFFTVVVVSWITFSWICRGLRNTPLDISIREEVKSDMGSEDSLKFSGINLLVHSLLNRFQLALFNFHFGLWSSVEKIVLFNDDRKVITIMLVFTHRPIIIKKE